MENFKFIVFSIIVLLIIGLVGYWAIFTIQPGSVHVEKEKQAELERENKELEKEIEELKSKLGVLESEQEKKEQIVAINEPEKPATVEKTPVVSSKNQSLINDLQKLITDKVVMKEGSRGTRVGTVQTFLNVYNNTSKKIDNDYGKGTKNDVIAFQKAVGLTADGEAGSTTFQKMIDWLKTH